MQIELGKHRKTGTINASSNKTPSSKRRKSTISLTATEPEAENETSEESVTTLFPLPSVGDYIALRCFKYKDFIPQIAKVRHISESDIEVEWLDGSYTGIWIPWKDHGKIIVKKFPRRAVIGVIALTASMRLKRNTIAALKEVYETTEYYV